MANKAKSSDNTTTATSTKAELTNAISDAMDNVSEALQTLDKAKAALKIATAFCKAKKNQAESMEKDAQEAPKALKAAKAVFKSATTSDETRRAADEVGKAEARALSQPKEAKILAKEAALAEIARDDAKVKVAEAKAAHKQAELLWIELCKQLPAASSNTDSSDSSDTDSTTTDVVPPMSTTSNSQEVEAPVADVEKPRKPAHNYIYLLSTKAHRDEGRLIYKVGKTTQNIAARINSYGRGTVALLTMSCVDCHTAERELINMFKLKYSLREGYEYFEGDCFSMMRDIQEVVARQLKDVTDPDLLFYSLSE